MRNMQESTEAGLYFLNFEFFLMRHYIIVSVLGLFYAGFWLLLVFDDLENEEGIDRLTWLVALLGIPLFGSIFYCRHMFNRMDNQTPSDGQPSWVKSLK